MPEEHSIRNIDQGSQRGYAKWPDFTPQNVLVVILILAVLGMVLYIFKPDLFKGISGKANSTASTKVEKKDEIKSSGYAAIFLVNNQVYFGKLYDADSNFPKLREVYYLRIERPLQPPPATESAQPDIQLVKLGNELHGPVDEIKFNRDQILYIEDLKTDSRVVKAIEEFKKRGR